MRILAGKRGQVRPPVIHLLGSVAASKLPMARLVAGELATRSAAGGTSCGFREINLTATAKAEAGGEYYTAAITPLCSERCPNLVVLAFIGGEGDGVSGIHAAEALLR